MSNNLDNRWISQLREALCDLPDIVAQQDLQPPGPAMLYVPTSHTKALGLDTTVVVGMRGAGKSVWTAALFDPDARRMLIQAGAPQVLERTHVRVGYSVDTMRGEHPSADVLQNLLGQGYEPRHLWKGVLARHIADVCELEFPSGNRHHEAVQWVQEDPEAFDELMAKGSRKLKDHEENLLVVFDALDTLPGKWEMVRPLARGVLEMALACRSYPNIRLKFFMRPDMEEDPALFDFRDSSKLLHNRVELTWRPVDLYGLVFHILTNGNAGAFFRELCKQQEDVYWKIENEVYYLPNYLRGNEASQRPIVEKLAGPYMGTNKRRGYTYTWIPTHLADSHGRVAPRSLLLALREAALLSREKYPEHSFPLHYEAIKKGVAQASQRRVEELSREDYPWVQPLLKELRGTTVPLSLLEVSERWSSSVLEDVMNISENKLPPRRYSSASPENRTIELLIDDLEELGVLYRTEDGRINIPDIFRVGFEIRRKGGVRPPVQRFHKREF